VTLSGSSRAPVRGRFLHSDPGGYTNYAQHPNGRLLMIESTETGADQQILVENWRAKVVAAFERDGE
jgi:hypothetical protein